MCASQTDFQSVRIRTAAWVGLAVLVAWLGWLGWSRARTWMLRQEVSKAVKVTDWGRAETALARLAWYQPDDLEMIRVRVGIALRRGDLTLAAQALAAVPESVPEAASAYLQRGLILKELYRAREAEAAFRTVLRRAPRLPEPRRELIALLGIERRAREQEEELWALHDESNCAIEALRLLAQSTVTIPPGTLAKTSDEGAVLERCLTANPDDSHLRPPLARFYRLRGDTDKARRLLESWLRDHPDDPPARIEWLSCLVDEGEVDGARPWFESPPASYRESAEFERVRGEWLNLQGKATEAVAAFREAVRLDPREPELRYRLAQSLRAAGRTDEADEALAYHRRLQELALLAAGIAEDHPAPDRLNEVGRLCRSLGREREAHAWFARSLQIDPANAETRAALGGPEVHATVGEAENTARGRGTL
jgi:tetratricopeptide (TPR) repeat protein